MINFDDFDCEKEFEAWWTAQDVEGLPKMLVDKTPLKQVFCAACAAHAKWVADQIAKVGTFQKDDKMPESW